MMDDRTLLKLAAKAAGMEWRWDRPTGMFRARTASDGDAFPVWNPLTDDGDALRLAVKLHINLEHLRTLKTMEFNEVAASPFGRGDCLATIATSDDPLAATRRAIVRAAASMVKETQ